MSGGSNEVQATFWLLNAPTSLVALSETQPDGVGLGTFNRDGTPWVYRKPVAASRSQTFIADAHEVSSRTFLAHIRHATAGEPTIENTHPFEQHGRLFAHNGVLGDLPALRGRLGGHAALVQGSTDSELYFTLMTKRIEELGDMIRTVDTCKVTDNLWGERWSKLCVNGMHNGVSAASGLSGNAMRQDDKIRHLIIALGGEAVRVGQAQGYRLEDIAGQDAEKLARASEGDKGALEEVEALMLALRNSQGRSEAQRPSMGQDMMKGRRTEIDFINGVIVERGAAMNRKVSTHQKLIAAVKDVELGRAKPSADLLYAIN